jgi:nucleoside-diphosphate-sugar epimerase
MKVLVAGGSGFIGKNFLLKSPPSWECIGTYNTSAHFPQYLKSKGLHHVKPVRVEMKNPESVKTAFRESETQFDVCLYVLGNSDIGLSRREPYTDLACNIHSLLNLIQVIKTGKFIFMSSGSVYEGYKSLINPSLKVEPTIPYSVSKLASERYIQYYHQNTDRIDSFVCLRFFGAYGPMEPRRKLYTKLIKDICIDKRDKITIMGNGKNFIDAMYIDDTIDALLKIARSDKGNVILDLCYGRPMTINELVMEIGSIFGRNITIQHQGSAAEYTTFFASPHHVEALFNFSPTTSLQEGMMKFADYVVNQNSRST